MINISLKKERYIIMGGITSVAERVYFDKYVKLTNKECIHNGYEFKEGLNEDKIPFNTTIDCYAGGIYFCKLRDIGRWLYYNNKEMYYIWDVKISEKVKNKKEVAHYINKSKASSVILSNKRRILDMEEWNNYHFQELIISSTWDTIIYNNINISQDIPISFTDKLQLLAMEHNINNVHGMIVISKQVQLEIIKKSPWYISYIKNPDEDVKKEALRMQRELKLKIT